jgi:peptidoglycan biosynthesis protein MviN/MurJ (putative lipid II flippase)
VAASLSLSYHFQDVGASVAMVIYESSLLIFNYYYASKTDPNLRIIDWRSLAHAMIGAILFVPLILIVRHWMKVDWVLLSLLIFLSALLYVSFLVFVLKNELINNLRRWGFKFISDQFQRRTRQ